MCEFVPHFINPFSFDQINMMRFYNIYEKSCTSGKLIMNSCASPHDLDLLIPVQPS